jgi:hypothetical protein
LNGLEIDMGSESIKSFLEARGCIARATEQGQSLFLRWERGLLLSIVKILSYELAAGRGFSKFNLQSFGLKIAGYGRTSERESPRHILRDPRAQRSLFRDPRS